VDDPFRFVAPSGDRLPRIRHVTWSHTGRRNRRRGRWQGARGRADRRRRGLRRLRRQRDVGRSLGSNDFRARVRRQSRAEGKVNTSHASNGEGSRAGKDQHERPCDQPSPSLGDPRYLDGIIVFVQHALRSRWVFPSRFWVVRRSTTQYRGAAEVRLPHEGQTDGLPSESSWPASPHDRSARRPRPRGSQRRQSPG
jgi:hypothetical protein